MKPNFALSLSFEGIRLLHRAAGGWRVVGDVALDAADMGGELAVLRRTASSLEPGGVRTKLLVPNEQIKYLTIPTPDMDDDARHAAAKGALDGATPYAVDDLAFDVSADGDQTHVAAVAHETLAEAEAFAVEHRFHPVSFAAIPADQPYLGEPFFGITSTASELLEDGETVVPDGIAVVVIGDVQAAKAVDPVPKPEPEAVSESASDVASEPEDAAPAEEAGTETSGGSAPKVAAPKMGTQDETADPESEDTKPKKSNQEDKGDAAPVAAKNKKQSQAAKPAESDAAVSEPNGPPPPVPAADPKKAAEPAAPTKQAAQAPTGATSEIETPKVAPPVKPTPPVTPTLGAASRSAPLTLSPQSSAQVSPPQLVDKPTNAPAAGFASRRSPDAPGASTTLPGAQRAPSLGAAKPPRSPGMSISDPSIPDMDGVIKPDSSSLAPQIPEAAAPPKASFLSRRKTKATALPQSPLKLAPAVAKPGSEAERMTVFGARRTDVGGKPRFLGLILTAALLVFLAGVAAWASVFLDDGFSLSRLFGDRSPRATASIPDPPKSAPDGVQTAALDPGLSEEDTAILDALREPIVPAVAVVTEAEAEAKYAATGIWPRAPQVPPEPAALIDIEDLYVTSIDPVSTSNDAVALPPPDGFLTDVAFGSVASPAAAGTQFAYDARGLVIPTVQGALSPDGFTVYLGRPLVVPTAFPNRSDAIPEENSAGDAQAKVRPRPRPGNLAETTERAQLDGLTKSELAAYRPLLRPQSVQQQAEAAVEAPVDVPVVDQPTFDTSDAVAAALAAAPEPTPPAIENATKYAVRASLRPDTRPRNFARIVKRAQRTAPAQQETQVASSAAVAPQIVTPKIPSNTSVARQATVKNAINLRNVNLIGVYGKPSNRRALVRLSNGRYKKVVVGDRIDGGRVSAIGDSELRYTKRGRNVVLKMPKG